MGILVAWRRWLEEATRWRLGEVEGRDQKDCLEWTIADMDNERGLVRMSSLSLDFS